MAGDYFSPLSFCKCPCLNLVGLCGRKERCKYKCFGFVSLGMLVLLQECVRLVLNYISFLCLCYCLSFFTPLSSLKCCLDTVFVSFIFLSWMPLIPRLPCVLLTSHLQLQEPDRRQSAKFKASRSGLASLGQRSFWMSCPSLLIGDANVPKVTLANPWV